MCKVCSTICSGSSVCAVAWLMAGPDWAPLTSLSFGAEVNIVQQELEKKRLCEEEEEEEEEE